MTSPQSTPVPAAATCQRCGQPLAASGGDEPGRKFCGQKCRRGAKKTRKRRRARSGPALRHPYVCGYCHHCGGGYVLAAGPFPHDTPPRYCSARCYGRSRWQASGGGFCTACQGNISDPAALVCGPCWQVAVRACLSKVRYDSQVEAADAARRRPQTANRAEYQCELCDGWHEKTTGTQQPPSKVNSTRRIITAMRPVYTRLRARQGLIHATVTRLRLPRAGF